MQYLYRVALAISLVGFTVSLDVHVRSILGSDLNHWILPFLFMIILQIPWMLAVDDIVDGSINQWRRRTHIGIQSSLEKQMLWGQSLFRGRPTWLKAIDYVILGYFFIIFISFLRKTYPIDTYSPHLGPRLPAPVATLFSSGWMAFYWYYLGTFWRVLKLNYKL
jgi:hypothetical protein